MWALKTAACADGASKGKDGFNKQSERPDSHFLCLHRQNWTRFLLHQRPTSSGRGDGVHVWIKNQRKPSPMCAPVADNHQAAVFRGNAGLECLCDVGKIRALGSAVWDFYNAGSNTKIPDVPFNKHYAGSDPAPNSKHCLQYQRNRWISTEPSSC